MSATLAKCPCNHCSGHIEFETQHAGDDAPCPHCGLDTRLFIPVAQTVLVPPIPVRGTSGGGTTTNLAVTINKQHGPLYYLAFVVCTLMVIGVFGVLSLFIILPVMARHSARAQQNTNQRISAALGASAPAAATVDLAREKLDYIQSHIQIYAIQSRYYESVLDGKLPGVEFKIKNTGDKTLKRIEVTVYFLDAAGKPIAEENYYPVSSGTYSGGHDPLKPGYIWQIESGKFYSAKAVPSEWSEGKVTVKIANIEFAD